MANVRDLVKPLIDGVSLKEVHDSDGREYFTFRIKRDADVIWRKLRDMLPSAGYWPIIVQNAEHTQSMLQAPRGAADSIQSILEAADKVDVGKWIAEWHKGRMEDFAAGIEEGEKVDDPFDCSVEDVREGQPKSQFYTTRDSSRAPIFFLIPTATSTEVPAYLRFGGLNDCPHPEVQVEFHRYWHKTYGSEIAVVTGAVVETVVARPVQGRDAALALAKEQYAYCYDIVEQGTGTIPALASELLNSTCWFFWWD
jgi:hypothetical protein